MSVLRKLTELSLEELEFLLANYKKVKLDVFLPETRALAESKIEEIEKEIKTRGLPNTR
tara:strand:+ start:2458 stop:2634 length:177 start_codon:yes stop_codon:yes gene_type:complete